MSDRTVYELARLAGCSAPDSADSPGARWLKQVESAAAEMLADCAEFGGDPTDAIHETADAAVPVYTHERWLVFVDLCAYNEDITDYGSDYGSDLTGAAGTALYVIAERLLYALLPEESDD